MRREFLSSNLKKVLKGKEITMNKVLLIGRLTKDVELNYTAERIAAATFSIAISRGKDKDGNDKGADFLRVKVFGKQAENCDRYIGKGNLVHVEGHIQTGSYKNKEGNTVYTTDVIAEHIEFIEWKDKETETDIKEEISDDDDISI